MFKVLSGISVIILMLAINIAPCQAANKMHSRVKKPALISQLANYESNSPAVKKLIANALHLSQMNLSYKFGSANPKNKGLDCSGTVYYLLHKQNIHHVPRQSDEQYDWVEDNGELRAVNNHQINSPEFSKLKPGDLLFWSGTYVTNRESPISHVMIYLGKTKKGQRLMFGSTTGRSYLGNKRSGVDVFALKLPNGKGPQRFEGYSCVPGLNCENRHLHPI